MVLYLDHMCQCGLHAELRSHVGTLMHRLAVEPRSIAGLLFPSRCSCATILLGRIRWCGTGGFQEQGQCFFIGQSCSIPTIIFSNFPFVIFLSKGWYCRALAFVFIGCISLSLSLALPTFNNNNNNSVEVLHSLSFI